MDVSKLLSLLLNNMARAIIIAGLIALYTTGAVFYGEQREKAKVALALAEAAKVLEEAEKKAGDDAIREYKELQIREEQLNDAPPDKCKLSPPLIRTMLSMCQRQKCA